VSGRVYWIKYCWRIFGVEYTIAYLVRKLVILYSGRMWKWYCVAEIGLYGRMWK